MQTLLYIYKRSFINRLMKALHKPVTYIYLVGILAYAALIFFGFGTMFTEMKIDSASGLAAILSFFAFVFIPGNIISFGKKKGLLFTPSDVHFVFAAPHNPKMVLMYAHAKQLALSIFLGLLLSICGVLFFHTSVLKMALYYIFVCVIENILESSLMVFLYGNEILSDQVRKLISIIMYGFIAVFFAIGLLQLATSGFQMDSVITYLHDERIQMVPVIGWNIAVIHFIFMGPTMVNVICSILYVVATILLLILAIRMKCTGAYYEDAMKFADDYAQARQKGKKGEVVLVGKTQKYGKASIVYKGKYGKAIFYRQILEYKKNKFFIFGMNTLVSLFVGIGIIVVDHFDNLSKMKEFVIPGVMAYAIFIFSGYATKWNKELDNPYTYLIPDTTFHKLWYATLMEHIRSLIDALIITVPAGIVLGISPIQGILTVLFYVCLQACKLYLTVMAEGLLGNLLGSVAKMILRMLLFGAILGMGALGAILGGLFLSVEAGFFLLILIVGIETFGCMFIAAGIFEKMEVNN